MLTCDLYLEQCSAGEIRLRDGTSTSGRVEICLLNEWGTICNFEWDTFDAKVACRQLGYPADGARALTGSDVPDGTGQIWLELVNCTGGEVALLACGVAISTPICSHSRDAGVACGEQM